MHVISPKKLRKFWSLHPDAERPLRAWLSVVEARRYASPHVLRSEEEYDTAIAEVERLLDLDPAPYTEEYERLEFLSVLAEAYERAHFTIEGATPADVVEFMLEQKGMARADVEPLLGGVHSAAEFFDQTRKLSRDEIEMVRDLLGIPADLLL